MQLAQARTPASANAVDVLVTLQAQALGQARLVFLNWSQDDFDSTWCNLFDFFPYALSILWEPADWATMAEADAAAHLIDTGRL